MPYTVPDTPNKPMRICVGGKEYFLQPGETVNVPDEVVSELLRALGIQHVPPDVQPPFEDPTVKSLDARVTALEAGGGGLPEVSAEDNGDVLTVVSGEWAKAAPSGGGNIEIVHFTCEGSVGGTATCDKTFSEIEALAQSGKDLLAEISIEAMEAPEPIYGKVISALTYFPAEGQDPSGINTYPVCFYCESNVCYVQVLWEDGEESPSYSAAVAVIG